MTIFSGTKSSDRKWVDHEHVADPDSKCTTCAYLSWPESTQALAFAMCDVIWHESAGDMADDIVVGLEHLGFKIVPK